MKTMMRMARPRMKLCSFRTLDFQLRSLVLGPNRSIYRSGGKNNIINSPYSPALLKFLLINVIALTDLICVIVVYLFDIYQLYLGF